MKHAKLLILSLVLLLVLAFCGCGIKFNLNFIVDGEIYETVRTGQNEIVEVPASPTKEGYIFDGWYWDEDVWQEPFTANSLLNAPISDNMSIYAKWLSKNVEIELKLLGGSLDIDSLEVTRGEKIGTLPTPVRQGYTFKQWVDQNGTPVTEDTIVSNGLSYITATWKINSYTVTFNPDNGEDSTTSNITYGGTIVAPNVTKENHLLLGWYNGDTKWDFDTDTVSESITLTAKWEVISKSVSLDANGGTVSQDTLSISYGSQIGSLPTPERSGYKFLGWYERSDINCNNQITESSIVTDNMELVARWTQLITIKFDNGIGTVEKSVQIEKGASLGNQLFVPVRNDGIVFVGWYSGAERITAETQFNENVTLFAVWSDSVICMVSNTYQHSWSLWKSTPASCTRDGQASRYCKSCGFQQTITVASALGHSFSEWSFDLINPLLKSRYCTACGLSDQFYYENLSSSIKETTIDGAVYGKDNVGCLYNSNWEESFGTTFAGNGGALSVIVEFTEATWVDAVFVKGEGNLVYSVKVKYAGDTEYTLISTNNVFGDKINKVDIGGEITEAVFETSFSGDGTWFWQEIAFVKGPDDADPDDSNTEPQPCQHTSWSMWDYTEATATCTEDGKAIRYCKDCGYKQEMIADPKLGHDYGEWSTDPENPLKKSRECYRCYKKQEITYTNLSSLILKTEISGNVFGENNVNCLYNGNWTETTGTFCGKNGSALCVTITFIEPTNADLIIIKGLGSYGYELYVLYEGDEDYSTITNTGSFGAIAQQHAVSSKRKISSVRILMPHGGHGDGFWQEIAICKAPALED